ncbi:MBL fold metallo-hydrolase [Maricurvus nonylphenolicus]|uniref:MBL fold metallo-hydrolase RNA specificity domain-containing protein n=1 Tax=Maricurvus nonylphenolicus TaxID=1008307 RepID=UPI0036F4130A
MSSSIQLSFFGAAGTVTGSRYLLDDGENKVLVDCGLFQGYKFLRERNRQPFPVQPSDIDGIFLTHAHLDHSGYIPALVAQGFKGPIYCTQASYDLCKVLLLDSAHIQEEEANFRNRHHLSKHHPAKPLYTIAQAESALGQFQPISPDNSGRVQANIGNILTEFHQNGHILGSSYLDVTINNRHILFSGDLGRPHDLIMKPPTPPSYCDYLVVESTYGDRIHDQRDLQANVSDIARETIKRGGSLLIPAFAVGRAQSMLFLLQQLRRSGEIPYVPIYLDSPMAINATEIMQRHHREHRLTHQQCQELSRDIFFLRTVEQSMALNHQNVPAIIVSASGMATGGRVLHHLRRMLGDYRNTVMFAGYQAGGTRGARLTQGAQQVKIFGEYFGVKARIEHLDFLSAHADCDEILQWLRKLPAPPKHCFITHGEAEAADLFRQKIQDELGWPASTPEMGSSAILD